MTTPLSVTRTGPARFTAVVRGHAVHTDQSVKGGGLDEHPSPLELLGSALGTCVALYATRFCEARGVDAEGLCVEVSTEQAPDSKRIARFELKLLLPPTVPEELRPLLERVARTCPVHHTLSHPAEIAVAVERAAIAGV